MKKLILAVILMTGLLWAEERKVTTGCQLSSVGSNSVMTPAGIYSSKMWFSEIVPVDKDVVKVVYHLRHIDNYVIYYTEYLKKGDKFYERLDKTGNNYNVYTLKEFGYNVLKFDVKSGEFKFTDLTTSY